MKIKKQLIKKNKMKTFKKLSMVMLVCTATASFGYAQLNDSSDEERPRFGLKAGFNYSNVYDEKGEDFVADGKVGGALGAFISIPFGTSFGFQPEILVSQRGFTATGSFIGRPYEMKRTTTHLDIPLLFALRPAPFITILAGPQYSYLLNQKDSYSSTNLDFNVENEFENDNIRKNTLSFVGGADINLGNVVVGSRVGFDLFENQGDGSSTTPRYKNVWVQATFGFRI